MPTDGQSLDYSKLRQDLVRAVARSCPGWLSSQRDDVVQGAIMRVVQIVERKSAANEGIPGFASSYIYKVAHSALIDEIRRVTRRRETDLDDPSVSAVVVDTKDPERVAASRQIGRSIQDCLARIKEERRLAVTLYLQGHTGPEMARILDWAAKRVENLVYRGLADLRECLMSKGIEP